MRVFIVIKSFNLLNGDIFLALKDGKLPCFEYDEKSGESPDHLFNQITDVDQSWLVTKKRDFFYKNDQINLVFSINLPANHKLKNDFYWEGYTFAVRHLDELSSKVIYYG